MTNVNLAMNLKSNSTNSDVEIVEELFSSRVEGEGKIFPKVRTALIEDGAQIITFEVDFDKLSGQQALFQLNTEK